MKGFTFSKLHKSRIRLLQDMKKMKKFDLQINHLSQTRKNVYVFPIYVYELQQDNPRLLVESLEREGILVTLAEMYRDYGELVYRKDIIVEPLRTRKNEFIGFHLELQQIQINTEIFDFADQNFEEIAEREIKRRSIVFFQYLERNNLYRTRNVDFYNCAHSGERNVC